MMPLAKTNYPELDRAYDLLWTAPEISLQLCNDFLKENPGNQTALRRKLFAHQRLKDWEGALGVADETIASNPSDPQAHTAAAEMHYRLGNYAQTIDHSHRAILADNDSWLGTIPYRFLAAGYARVGDLAMAYTYAERAAAIDPKSFVPYGPLPSGTLSEFKQHLAHYARG